MKTQNTLLALAALTLILNHEVRAQGSLTPPGAPAPTMKTLEQVEPRTDLSTVTGDATFHHVISQPGSYYLSGNLGVTKPSGISINAVGVTLDLNGFRISRASASGGYGIYIAAGMDGTTVRNGSIVGFQYGIYSYSTPVFASGCLFEKLTASVCTSYGIYAGSASRIVDCCAHGNSGIGIYARGGSSLRGCTAYNNQGQYSIYTSSGSNLSGCTAFDNLGIGIYAGPGSSLSGCIASYNKGLCGIYAGEGSSLSSCCAFNNEGTLSSSYGIYAEYGSTVANCVAHDNSNTNSPSTSLQGVGIYAASSSTVQGCTVSYNSGDGIRINGDCAVMGNTCGGNGNTGDGAGVHATSSDNRVDGNNVTDNDRGIDVDATGNLIIRNSASGNTADYDIVAGNKDAEVLTPGSGFTATNPWANFSF